MDTYGHEGQHSITFDEIKFGGDNTARNTWTDWCLIPSKRPTISTPTVKTSSIEIPGANGLLDTTEALTGYPLYGNATGSLEFIIDQNRSKLSWIDLYNELKMFFHGRELKMTLSDEPDYYRIGRFKVNKWTSDQSRSTITIDYEIKPYRYYYLSTIEDWRWDPFNFETGYVYQNKFDNIVVDRDMNDWTPANAFELTKKMIGNMPVVPTWHIKIDEDSEETYMQVALHNVYRGVTIFRNLDAGATREATITDPQLIFLPIDDHDIVRLQFCGHATFSIEFRPGRL